jgi:sarcosine oxidase subunit beta
MRAAQRIEGLAIEGRARGTVGLYDVSDDWIPVYDKSPLSGYFVAIGTSGNQFKNAPYIGELMLAIVRHELSGFDHDQAPASLHLAEIGQTIDLRFYSRNRPKQSTRSVLA